MRIRISLLVDKEEEFTLRKFVAEEELLLIVACDKAHLPTFKKLSNPISLIEARTQRKIIQKNEGMMKRRPYGLYFFIVTCKQKLREQKNLKRQSFGRMSLEFKGRHFKFSILKLVIIKCTNFLEFKDFGWLYRATESIALTFVNWTQRVRGYYYSLCSHFGEGIRISIDKRIIIY